MNEFNANSLIFLIKNSFFAKKQQKIKKMYHFPKKLSIFAL